MRPIFCLPLLSVCALHGALVRGWAAEAEPLVISVDSGKPLHQLPTAWNGSNFCALWNPSGYSAGLSTAAAQLGLGLLRFPGGVPCQWYDWETPLATGWSTTTPALAWQLGQECGAQMVFQTNTANDSTGINKATGAKYHFDSSGTHAAQWVKWARDNKVKVAFWEIGNEPEMDAPGPAKKTQETVYAWYNAKYAEQVKAIRSIDPQARILGPAATNTWYWWTQENLRKFLKVHGNKGGTGLADGISLHWYPGGSDARWEDKRATAQGWQACWDHIQQVIAECDKRQLPVYLTEWNWGAGDKNNGAGQLANALGCADCIGMFRRTGVAGQTHFVLQHVDKGWGVLAVHGESKAENHASPTFYALAITARLGSEVLAVTNPADEGKVLATYAARDALGGIQVMLINKTDTPLAVEVAFATKDKAAAFNPLNQQVAIYSLVGSSGTNVYDERISYNGIPDPAPAAGPLPAPATAVAGKTFPTTLPPYSLTVLAFPGRSPANPSVKDAAQAPAKTAAH